MVVRCSCFLIFLVLACLFKCWGSEEFCGKKCKDLNDCPSHLLCDPNGECTDDPAIPPVKCPIGNCRPTKTFTYTNDSIDKDHCQKNSVYQYFSCSPPLRNRNFAIFYFIELDRLNVACDKKPHNNSQKLANMATGWFNNGSSCLQNITITALDNGRSTVAQVVDECQSTDGCSAATEYYEPCPPRSIGGTKAVWDALGHNVSDGVIQVSWVFSAPHKGRGWNHRKAIVIASTSSAGFAVLLTLSLLICWLQKSLDQKALRNVKRHLAEEVQQHVIKPQQFKYHTLRKATRGFDPKSIIGEGGFGTVYKGMLPNGAVIAVKKIKQGHKQFKAEVMSIGSIRHLNLVKLLGFSINSHVHMLVYEYLCNGSLDMWLFSKDKFLPWGRRVLIALDVARGLAYLHDGCRDKVLHLDIKPQNILLDGNMTAKIADFGFSKLIAKEESHAVTVMRGTIGYMAPEWLQSRVTDRTDVYSFGMVLLELACGRKCIEFPSETGQEIKFLAEIAFSKLDAGLGWELVDKRMITSDESRTADIGFDFNGFEKMIRIGLWCIQEDPAARPTMGLVVKMLEGGVNELNSPSLIRPTSNASMALASATTSEDSIMQISLSISDLAR